MLIRLRLVKTIFENYLSGILKEKLSEVATIEEVEQVLVPENGTIIFCLKDGRQIKKSWQNKDTLNELYNTEKFDAEVSKLIEEKDKIENNAKELVMKNAQIALDQDTYNAEYNKFSVAFENIKQKVSELEKQKSIQISKKYQAESFLKKINQTENFLEEFNEELWLSLVKVIRVGSDGTRTLVFKNGVEVKI